VIGLEALTIRKLSFQQARAITIDNYGLHNHNVSLLQGVSTKDLKISQGQSETVKRRRTNNAMVKRKWKKNDLQNIT
jgi:hypothetical protein